MIWGIPLSHESSSALTTRRPRLLQLLFVGQLGQVFLGLLSAIFYFIFVSFSDLRLCPIPDCKGDLKARRDYEGKEAGVALHLWNHYQDALNATYLRDDRICILCHPRGDGKQFRSVQLTKAHRVSKSQVRLGQVRLGRVRLGQVRFDWIRLG